MSGNASSGTRVVRLVSDYPVNGRPTYGLQPNFYYLSREQVRQGFDVLVIAHRKGGQPAYELFDGVEIHRVEKPYPVSAIRLLSRMLRNPGEKIVHTHATNGFFLSLVPRSVLGAPLVSQVHGTSVSGYMPATLKFGEQVMGYSPWGVSMAYLREKTLWSSADMVLTPSRPVRADLETRYGIDGERVRVVYNGFDSELFRPVDGSELKRKLGLEGKKVVLYVGHFGLRKGIFYLIEAMVRVATEVPGATLVCIGGVPSWLGKNDYWSFLKGFIEKNGLEGRVVLLDKVPNKDLPQYYSMADAFVLPSYYEAFAKVVVEAMACGKPVVASNMGGNLDAIEEGRNGFLVRFGDSEQIASAVTTILQDERLSRAMGTAGRARALENYTWTKVAERIASAYSEVMSGRPSAEPVEA